MHITNKPTNQQTNKKKPTNQNKPYYLKMSEETNKNHLSDEETNENHLSDEETNENHLSEETKNEEFQKLIKNTSNFVEIEDSLKNLRKKKKAMESEIKSYMTDNKKNDLNLPNGTIIELNKENKLTVKPKNIKPFKIKRNTPWTLYSTEYINSKKNCPEYIEQPIEQPPKKKAKKDDNDDKDDKDNNSMTNDSSKMVDTRLQIFGLIRKKAGIEWKNSDSETKQKYKIKAEELNNSCLNEYHKYYDSVQSSYTITHLINSVEEINDMSSSKLLYLCGLFDHTKIIKGIKKKEMRQALIEIYNNAI